VPQAQRSMMTLHHRHCHWAQVHHVKHNGNLPCPQLLENAAMTKKQNKQNAFFRKHFF